MKLTELRNLFETQDFDTILSNLQPVFDEIDEIAEALGEGIGVEESICLEYLSKLTGYYMYLSPFLNEAKTQKRNNELIRYRELKEEAESEGKKFISAPAEKEAQIYVAEYRKIRNALQAYVDACKVGIGSCQSIVKYKSEEKKYLGAE